MNKLMGLSLLVLLASSCSIPMDELTSEGESVKVVDSRPKDCKPVGAFQGLNEEGSTDMATVHARNLAGDKDANTLYVDDTLSQGFKRRVLATGYVCD